jgi:hypothetical protein
MRCEQSRTDATSREQSRTVTNVRGQDDRYVTHLESENDFLRAQMEVKDTQIKCA